MKLKKLLSMSLCLVMTVGLLAGCGGKEPEENVDPNGGEKKPSTNTGAGDLVIDGLGTDENADYTVEGTITVAVDTARATDYEALFDALQQAYPKLEISFDYFSHTTEDSAAEYLSTRAAAGKLPDIVWDEAGKLPLYVSQGWVYPLDEFVKDDPDFQYVPQNLVDDYTYCGKLYALPHQAHFELMYVNLDALDGHNLDMPRLDWTTDDFESYLKAGTDSVYSGMENLGQIPSLLVSTFNPKTSMYGYDEETRQLDMSGVVKSYQYSLNIRNIPGVDAQSLKRSISGGESDYVKKFGGSSSGFDQGLTLFHGVGTWELADAQERWSDKNWTYWTIPQSPDGVGVMPYHVDHCFMTSSCENTKAAWQVLRFITYSTEGNLARLSMYDEKNDGKYMTINKLYYPTNTNPKVAEKFESLPSVQDVDKYLFENINNCKRFDLLKIVPSWTDVTSNYFASETMNTLWDGTASMVEPTLNDIGSKANKALEDAWRTFEEKVQTVQKEFEQNHAK